MMFTSITGLFYIRLRLDLGLVSWHQESGQLLPQHPVIHVRVQLAHIVLYDKSRKNLKI